MTTRGASTRAPALRLIGGFRVSIDAVDIRLPRSEQRLLALLALRDGDHSRSALAGDLWPDATRDPRANLRGVVLRLDERVRDHVVVRADSLDLTESWDVDARIAIAAARDLEGDELPCPRWPLAELYCTDLHPDAQDVLSRTSSGQDGRNGRRMGAGRIRRALDLAAAAGLDHVP